MSLRLPHNRLAAVGVFVALGMLSTACVRQEPPTVGMSKVEANLVFGLDAVPEPVQTPVEQVVAQFAPPPIIQDAAAPEAPAPAPDFNFTPGPKVPLLRPTTSATRVECPTAPVTAAAEVPPQPRISGDVATGTSKWRIDGFLTARSGAEPVRTELADGADVPRSVRNVKKISDTRYSFEVVKAGDTVSGSDNVTITTYEVNTAGVNVNPAQGVGTVTTPNIGEPERGIVISRIQTVDRDSGQQLRDFQPQVGLLVLPLPVVAGDTYRSTAIDPSTGQTIALDSTVVGRERIDACGTLVDGWLVRSKQRSTSGPSDAPSLAGEIDVATIFATQYGGVPIQETQAYTGEDCTICPFQFRSRLGQLPPDPLPAS